MNKEKIYDITVLTGSGRGPLSTKEFFTVRHLPMTRKAYGDKGPEESDWFEETFENKIDAINFCNFCIENDLNFSPRRHLTIVENTHVLYRR